MSPPLPDPIPPPHPPTKPPRLTQAGCRLVEEDYRRLLNSVDADGYSTPLACRAEEAARRFDSSEGFISTYNERSPRG